MVEDPEQIVVLLEVNVAVGKTFTVTGKFIGAPLQLFKSVSITCTFPAPEPVQLTVIEFVVVTGD